MNRRLAVADGLAVVGGLVALAFAGWEGTQQRDSAASHWGIAGSLAVVLAAALVAGRGRQQTSSTDWVRQSVRPLLDWPKRPRRMTGVTIWVLVAVVVVGWDVTSLVAQSHDLPTFSYLVGRITRRPWGRATVLAAWLAVGSTFALGNRTHRT